MTRTGALQTLMLLPLVAMQTACDSKPTPPHAAVASSSASAEHKPARLDSDLSEFSAWAELDTGASPVPLLAPYRLAGAFALQSDGRLRVHFSRSASTCREFLENPASSRTLFLDRAEPGLKLLEASAARGVRAQWSATRAEACEQSVDTICPRVQLVSGRFTAAGCGVVDDLHVKTETIVMPGTTDLDFQIDGKPLDLRVACVTDYFEWQRSEPSEVPSPKRVLGAGPKLRVLELGGEALHCLTHDRFPRVYAAVHYDVSTKSVKQLRLETDKKTLIEIEQPKLDFELSEAPPSEPVRFRIEARGRHANHRFRLQGTGVASRCN